ncbi:hypothetical protein ACFP47_06335 [Nesterenkonia lacusekhoensis]|uniref:Uncharacterized protein n=1 Tax=Nesterenkonia lacusekhoensis TaxID=150832 RepID=A0ABS4T491_9MICC|nr:hypothetical protein [Nesterenkonia lacusekhoensis]MBP2318116.1 hypothetical protein [Nesterenkonia lacusekhoensis]
MITDTIQGVLLLLAAGTIFVVLFAEFGFDWGVFRDLA